MSGSVARGDAGPNSDIDVLVDLHSVEQMSHALQVAGIGEGFREGLGVDIDVCTPELTKDVIPAGVLDESVPLSCGDNLKCGSAGSSDCSTI